MSPSQHVHCTGAPISWLELERYVLGESLRVEEIDGHLAECRACDSIAERIRQDQRALPGLELPLADLLPRKRRWSWRLSLLLAPLLVLLFVWRGKGGDSSQGESVKGGVKGAEPSFVLIRERGSSFLEPTHFAEGDRFKALLTCAPTGDRPQYVDLVVEQEGRLFYPLESSAIPCGNKVPVPGAFSLDGGPARVCLILGDADRVPRHSIPADAMCLEVDPVVGRSE